MDPLVAPIIVLNSNTLRAVDSTVNSFAESKEDYIIVSSPACPFSFSSKINCSMYIRTKEINNETAIEMKSSQPSEEVKSGYTDEDEDEDDEISSKNETRGVQRESGKHSVVSQPKSKMWYLEEKAHFPPGIINICLHVVLIPYILYVEIYIYKISYFICKNLTLWLIFLCFIPTCIICRIFFFEHLRDTIGNK